MVGCGRGCKLAVSGGACRPPPRSSGNCGPRGPREGGGKGQEAILKPGRETIWKQGKLVVALTALAHRRLHLPGRERHGGCPSSRPPHPLCGFRAPGAPGALVYITSPSPSVSVCQYAPTHPQSHRSTCTRPQVETIPHARRRPVGCQRTVPVLSEAVASGVCLRWAGGQLPSHHCKIAKSFPFLAWWQLGGS